MAETCAYKSSREEICTLTLQGLRCIDVTNGRADSLEETEQRQTGSPKVAAAETSLRTDHRPEILPLPHEPGPSKNHRLQVWDYL